MIKRVYKIGIRKDNRNKVHMTILTTAGRYGARVGSSDGMNPSYNESKDFVHELK
jgi:hypothetical protein